MAAGTNIDYEFNEVLKLPITEDEKNRYKYFLARQHPEYGMVGTQMIEKLIEDQPIAFTPSQIIRLKEKSMNLRRSGVLAPHKEQALEELLACALLAEFLNRIHLVHGTPEIGIIDFQSALFSIQSVPRPNQRPDVFVHSRSHRNKKIPNMGYGEEDKPVEVMEFEQFAFARKPDAIHIERHIADHVINTKINKVNAHGLFPYEPNTRLVVHIDSNISMSSVNLNTAARFIYQALEVHKLANEHNFSEIYFVQFTDMMHKSGRVTQIFPYICRQRINFEHLPDNYPALYKNPLFDA